MMGGWVGGGVDMNAYTMVIYITLVNIKYLVMEDRMMQEYKNYW